MPTDLVSDGDTNWGANIREVITRKNELTDDADTTEKRVPTARLGTGTADTTTFLRGDRTWANPLAGAFLVPTVTFNDSGVATANTTAIAAALTSAASTGKTVLLAGKGTVWINPLTVAAGVRLTVDLGVTLKHTTPSGGAALISVGAGGVVDGFGTIDGNRSASPSTSASRGVQFTGSGAVVKDVTIQQTAGAGVYIEPSADNCWVLNTTLLDNGREGVYAEVSGTTAAGDYALISGNRIERPGRQVADALGTEGVGIKAVGDSATHVIGQEGLRIIGNHVLDPAVSECCIEVWGFGRHSVIANNHCRGGLMGISVDACHYTAVTGNTVYNAADLGIEFAGGERGTCVGNIINGNGNTHTGISITSSDVAGTAESVTCVGNTVSNLDTSATAAFGTGPSRCINVMDMSRVVVGPGNILFPPSNGNGVRIHSNSSSVTMTAIKVVGNLMKGGASGIQFANSTSTAARMVRVVLENNTIEDTTLGADFDFCTNVYGSGNKFLGVTTPKSGTGNITGDNDWQANFPRTVNN